MTVNEIKKRAFDSIPDQVFSENYSMIEAFLENAIQTVETYCGRCFDVKTYKQYVEREDWERFGDKYRLIPAITPIVSSDLTYGKDFLLSDEPLEEIEYTAGFVNNPPDIEHLIYLLTIYEINRSLGNTYNFSVKTVVTGSSTTNINEAREDFYREELMRLDKYKSKSYYSAVIEVE